MGPPENPVRFTLKSCGQPGRGNIIGNTKTQGSRVFVGEPCDVDGTVERCQNGTDFVQEEMPRPGQVRSGWATLDQASPDVGFQRVDRLTERRLAQAEPVGGSMQAARFGQHVEMVEMAQVHDPLAIA